MKRYLIVNADDFGQSEGINRGIVQAHEHGIVTSASLLVRGRAAAPAAAYAQMHPALSIGLHVDLGEWAYRRGRWVTLYQVVTTDDRAAVSQELAHQLKVFRQLVGRNPTHLDSHQHVHRTEPVRSVLLEAAGEFGIPLRDCTPQIRYNGRFYGQFANGKTFRHPISIMGLVEILESLSPGITELGCHPGLDNDVDSMYRRERAVEVRTLCDPRVHEVLKLQDIELVSFKSLPCLVC